MAQYDSPGFRGATPTGNLDQRSGTATGSVPSRTPSPDDATPSIETGLPGVGTVLPLAQQTSSGEGASPEQPGQVDASVLTPGPAEGYASTGAGRGHNIADQHRYPWQAAAGGQ